MTQKLKQCQFCGSDDANHDYRYPHPAEEIRQQIAEKDAEIAALKEQIAAMQWIKCSDRLPDESTQCGQFHIIADGKPCIGKWIVDYADYTGFAYEDGDSDYVFLGDDATGCHSRSHLKTKFTHHRKEESMKKLLSFALLAISILMCITAQAQTPLVIQAPDANGNIIKLTTAPWAAQSFCSLTWGGHEFLNCADHGRGLQSAVSFDGMGELQNPTEAGSYANGSTGNPSDSIVTYQAAWMNQGGTQVHPAYWKMYNGKLRWDGYIQKQVTIGVPGIANVIDYTVTFTIPYGEAHSSATFEALTMYSPATNCYLDVCRFQAINLAGGEYSPHDITDGPGEQPLPLVFLSQYDNYSVGVYSPSSDISYGRFRFPADGVVKWNAVFRVNNPSYGTYTRRIFVVVGSYFDVINSMKQLYAQYH